MSLIELKHVDKYYPIGDHDRFQALNDVTLNFKRGELVAIIGESGSGKSTMMNIIGGLDSDFEGEINFHNQNIKNYSERELVEYRKNNIGFVFQNFNLISHLSILDNVTLAMTLSNVDKQTRLQRAEEILARVGLSDQLHKKPNQLSGGQKQRVAIARALVNDPDIIIADEPTGALDSETADSVMELISSLADDGKLVIIVTHSQRVAEECSRNVEISDGIIVNDISLKAQTLQDKEPEFVHKNKNLSFLAAIKLSLQNMKAKFGRNILVALGGSIGITSVVLMLSLGAGINRYLINTMSAQVNPLVSEARLNTSPAEVSEEEDVASLIGESDVYSQMMDVEYFSDEDIETLSDLEGLDHLEKGYNNFGLGYFFGKVDDKEAPFMMVNTVSPMMTDSDIAEGRKPSNHEVMLSKGYANSFGEHIVGKTIDLRIMVNNVPVEFEATVSGIYGPDNVGPESLLNSIYVDYDFLVNEAKSHDVELGATVVYLVAEDEDSTSLVKEQVNDLGYRGSASDNMIDLFSEMLDIFTFVLTGVSAISLIVSAIMILTVLFISVVERTNEIGVLKAIGARRKDIRRIFVSEAFLIGLFSGVVGVINAYGLSFIFNRFALNTFNTTVLWVKPEYLTAGILVSIIISMVAGVLPASRASKLDPVESLRHD